MAQVLSHNDDQNQLAQKSCMSGVVSLISLFARLQFPENFQFAARKERWDLCGSANLSISFLLQNRRRSSLLACHHHDHAPSAFARSPGFQRLTHVPVGVGFFFF